MAKSKKAAAAEPEVVEAPAPELTPVQKLNQANDLIADALSGFPPGTVDTDGIRTMMERVTAQAAAAPMPKKYRAQIGAAVDGSV